MIITCPQCETRYTADAASFPASGRKVRCSKCGHAWNQPAPEPERVLMPDPVPASSATEAVVAAAPGFAAARANVIPRTQGLRRSWAERVGLIAGWTGLAAILVLIGWMGLRFHDQIQALWPQSSALYATFGVKVHSGAVEISDVSYRPEMENGRPVLEVSARLVNVSSHEATVPRVRVALTDEGDRDLLNVIKNPPLHTLAVGQSVGFSFKLTQLPPGTKNLQLQFASQD